MSEWCPCQGIAKQQSLPMHCYIVNILKHCICTCCHSAMQQVTPVTTTVEQHCYNTPQGYESAATILRCSTLSSGRRSRRGLPAEQCTCMTSEHNAHDASSHVFRQTSALQIDYTATGHCDVTDVTSHAVATPPQLLSSLSYPKYEPF